MKKFLLTLCCTIAVGFMAGCTTTNVQYLSVSDYPGTFIPTYYDGEHPGYNAVYMSSY